MNPSLSGASSPSALFVTMAAAALVCSPPAARAQGVVPAESLLRSRIEALSTGAPVTASGDRLLARQALPRFYEERAFALAWSGRGASPAALDELERAIARAEDHGLNPDDYHAEAIAELRGRLRNGEAPDPEWVDLDLLASDAFMVLASHLLHGRVNPETINAEWLANRRSAAMHSVLADALDRTAIERAIYEQAPAQPRYQAMLRAAARLRTVEATGGWPTVSEGPALEIGSQGTRVVELRRRLAASGDLTGEVDESGIFDDGLVGAVRLFQERHGLEADGVVGPATLRALNVPAAVRVGTLETNLERWRWLPADLGERHIEVNIAGFDVKVVDKGRTVRVHRAVVGRQYRQTPSFTGQMTYLVLAPYWHVPPTIAAVDKLPVMKSDVTALASQQIHLLDASGVRRIDPASVDWSTMTGPEFNRRFRLRQDPGPQNALGAVKFMFPNNHNVYLHDTPSRELFSQTSRTFSSGCIRIEGALELAEFLLADQPEWTPERIAQSAGGGVERSVRLTRAVPVHLLYWTAWAAADGTIHFRDDVYGRDPEVARAVDAPPPGL